MRGMRSRVAAEPVRAAIGLTGTVTLHALAAATFLAGGTRARSLPPIAYQVELVAAPAPAAEAPAQEPAPSAAPAPRPEPVAPLPRPAPAPRAAAPPAPAPSAVSPVGQPGVGSDVAPVRTEGVEFPFPGYLRNLVAQVYRRWRPPPSSAALEAEIFFLLHRDGSVTGLQFIRRSGSFAFDLEAQGAVEAAARVNGFGALPEGYGADVLPVSFFFSPSRAQR